MRIYLIQHGKTLPKAIYPEQPLSEEGKKETAAAANYFKSRQIKVAEIWHSAKSRAVETAEILKKELKSAKVRQRDDLNPDSSVQPVHAEISRLQKDLVIVGHLPFLEKLTALLMCSDENRPCSIFYHSGIVCLEHTAQGWNFAWFLTPQMLESHDLLEEYDTISDDRLTSD